MHSVNIQKRQKRLEKCMKDRRKIEKTNRKIPPKARSCVQGEDSPRFAKVQRCVLPLSLSLCLFVCLLLQGKRNSHPFRVFLLLLLMLFSGLRFFSLCFVLFISFVNCLDKFQAKYASASASASVQGQVSMHIDHGA